MAKDENVDGMGKPLVGQFLSSFDLQCYMRFIRYVVLIRENTEPQFYFIHAKVNSFLEFNKLEGWRKGEILYDNMLWLI